MSIYGKAKLENGFLQVHLSDFIELMEFSQFFHTGVGKYYFRGQSNAEWGLTTTLERFEETLLKSVGGTQDKIFKDFKRQLRGKGIAGLGTTSDDDLLALGQHYGLPTPLLDWSDSFFIALFFAYADDLEGNSENIAVWVLQEHVNKIFQDFNIHMKSAEEKNGGGVFEYYFKFIDPFTDYNDRLLSQAGVFIQKPSKADIVEVVQNYCKGNSKSPLLGKITMPASAREIVLNNLNAMNINWSTIYPGFEGAAKHAKLSLQLLDMKVRRMGEAGMKEHLAKQVTYKKLD